MDGLLHLAAAYDGDVPVVRFPDDSAVRGDDDGIRAALSEHVVREVSLAGSARTCCCAPPRCVMVTLPQVGVERDQHLLRTVTRHNDANLRVLAEVVRVGEVAVGDRVRLMDEGSPTCRAFREAAARAARR
jgi:hypothetical protein